MRVELVLPYGLLIFAAALAFGADRLVARQGLEGGRGAYWNRAAAYSVYPLALLLLLSQTLPEFGWPLLWTLRLDRLGGELHYRLALSLPFIAWGLALLAAWRVRALPTLAGGVGFANSRRWLLWCDLPLALILVYEAGNLGGGEEAYPAALWAVLAVSLPTLAGLAFSADVRADEGAAEPSVPSAHAAQDRSWPEWMTANGIQVRALLACAAAPPRPVKGADAQIFAQGLQAMGAAGVAPGVVESVAALLRREPPGGDYGAIRLLFAPDGSGQLEALGLAAALLHRQFHTATLVVVPQGALDLALQLRRWLPDGVAALDYGEIPDDALVWVADAELLSDRLLGRLKNPRLARRVGLVAWWRLDAYSGVMAANVWAISRRLHRLLRAQGRHDLRTLALLREASAEAQLGDFVRRLLPHAQPPASHAGSDWARACQVYLLTTQARPVAGGRYLLLRAASVSVAGGWPTCVQPAAFMTAQELAQFRQSPASGGTLDDALRPDAASADVRLLHLSAADVLALPSLLAQTGRALPGSAPCHIGLIPPSNPYAAHLLDRLAKSRALPAARRLVCAESCPSVIRRHLLLALNELPDTRRGLLESALSNEQTVDETLRDLADAGQLSQREVRFLGTDGRLACEFEYQSLRIPSGQYHPLDTVGEALLEVREGESVLLRLDPERLLIAAYPGRVFLSGGRRYRVRHWHSVAEATARGWVECQREDQCQVTWRIHSASVYGIRPWRGESEVAIGHLLTRLAVELHYQEEVTGLVEWSEDLCHPLEVPKTSYFTAPHSLSFKTRALILRLPFPPEDAAALPSLCQALRHVLPVHLGVEEDALEVACLNGAGIQGEPSYGLAIVDLYPGGIGLTDAIRDDSALLLRLLEWTCGWLEACPDDALQTPMALAANPSHALHREAALRLLGQVL